MTLAVILCANKCIRMGNNSKNKVIFDYAGVPVIKRIVTVVGHLTYTAMNTLDGKDRVMCTYQKGVSAKFFTDRRNRKTSLRSVPAISTGDKRVDSCTVADPAIRVKWVKDGLGCVDDNSRHWCNSYPYVYQKTYSIMYRCRTL